MPEHDIVVIGGSAGAVESIKELVRALPAKLDASVFIVIHFPRRVHSVLPHLLRQHTSMPVVHAVDGQPIERGKIYVAPPDHHLLIKPGIVRVTLGPLEHSLRPAIDPLFRTAARAYGARVVGVVLSGCMDDGTAGMRDIVRAGGVALVQSPAEALFGDMPQNVLHQNDTARELSVAQIGEAIGKLSMQSVLEKEGYPMSDNTGWQDIAEMSDHEIRERDIPGTPAGLTCPDCHGNLWVSDDGVLVRYECRIGHGYTPRSLDDAQRKDLEKNGIILYRSLEERRQLALSLLQLAEGRKLPEAALFYRKNAKVMDEKAGELSQIIAPLEQEGLGFEAAQEQLRQLEEMEQDEPFASGKRLEPRQPMADKLPTS